MKGKSRSFMNFIRSGLLLIVMVFAMAALPGFSSKTLAAEYPDYMSFTAVDGDVTIGMKKSRNPDDFVLEYSKDRQNWTSVTLTDTNERIVTIPRGETYYFRTDRERDGLGKGSRYDEDNSCYWSFLMTGEGKVKAGGNIMSLLDPTCEKTSLGGYAFYDLFSYCFSLLTAPKLPAQTLAESCYKGMFSSCSNLTEAPELPAQNLDFCCYKDMFSGCSSLTVAPKLSAQTMAYGCYADMFSGCSSLTEAPELSAQNLAFDCYSGMFYSCSSLTDAPELPAQTLAPGCYENMFFNCSSLTEAPELPAQTLAPCCYSGMFYSCSSLTKAPELPAQTLSDYCYTCMFYSCSSLTEAPELPAETLASGCYMNMFSRCSSLTEAPELPAETLASYCYRQMFFYCSSLTEAPELPAETLADNCYEGMFSACISLTETPELPAETLASGCYSNMFFYCISLTEAPELPAQTLVYRCYADMFNSCSSLTEAPELPAETLAGDCYSGMFAGCSSLTKAPELPAKTLAEQCYASMFWGCSSLTKAPELPAQTLAYGCYANMFSDCIKLFSVTIGFVEAEVSLEDFLANWLYGVSETGTLYCPKSTMQYTNEELGLPAGWVKKDTEQKQKINSFVTRMYEQCLSRDPDQAGLEGWAGQLENGNMNGAQLAEQFVFSEEMLNKNLSDAEFVKVLYRSMMGREADEAGLDGWLSQLQGGHLSRSEVTEAFVESAEFTAICSEYGITRGDFAAVGDIERFVTRFYTICLGREADQKGHWGWVENLRDKHMNGAQIAEAFFFSEEFVNKNVSDEVYIATLYRTILGREADAAGLKGWVEQLQNNQMTRRDILGAFIESTEFSGICAGYGIERGSL